MIDGIYTVTDDHLYALVALIRDSEGLALEPSAVAGAPGFAHVLGRQTELGADLAGASLLRDATHIIWATGGSMVPADEMNAYYQKGLTLL